MDSLQNTVKRPATLETKQNSENPPKLLLWFINAQYCLFDIHIPVQFSSFGSFLGVYYALFFIIDYAFLFWIGLQFYKEKEGVLF